MARSGKTPHPRPSAAPSGVTTTIDLNSDLGESLGPWQLGDDAAMLDLVTSANIACGFHAGDPSVLRRTCDGASRRGVAIGAQVSYRDLIGFGRRFVDVAADDLTDDVLYQLGALEAFARIAGSRVRYVKPHGALYNSVATHEEQAAAVVRAVRRYDPTLPILGLPGSALLAAADRTGLRAVPEAFADRAYTDTGTLVPRSNAGAVLTDPQTVAARVLRLVTQGTLDSATGRRLRIEAESVCVHGDSPGAVAMTSAIRQTLHAAGIRIESFT